MDNRGWRPVCSPDCDDELTWLTLRSAANADPARASATPADSPASPFGDYAAMRPVQVDAGGEGAGSETPEPAELSPAPPRPSPAALERAVADALDRGADDLDELCSPAASSRVPDALRWRVWAAVLPPAPSVDDVPHDWLPMAPDDVRAAAYQHLRPDGGRDDQLRAALRLLLRYHAPRLDSCESYDEVPRGFGADLRAFDECVLPGGGGVLLICVARLLLQDNGEDAFRLARALRRRTPRELLDLVASLRFDDPCAPPTSAHRRRLEAFYAAHAPAKLPALDALIDEHGGPALCLAVARKYGRPVPPDPRPDLAAREAALRWLAPDSFCVALAPAAVVPRAVPFEAHVPEAGDVSSRVDVGVVATADDVAFVIVDVRPAEEFAAGHLEHALHLAPSLLQDPEAMESVLEALLPLRGRVHFCLQGAGAVAATYAAAQAARVAERSTLDLAATFFLRRRFPFVSVMRGGFAAAHQLLQGNVEGHEERKCRVCRQGALRGMV